MSFWQILGRFAVSDTVEKVSDTTRVSSDGTHYTKMGSTTVGSDGSVFTQMGGFSTDAAPAWAARPLDLALFSITKITGQTQYLVPDVRTSDSAWMMINFKFCTN